MGLNFPSIHRLLLLAALAQSPLPASVTPLRWDSTEITLAAPPLAESVEAAFKFTNASDRPVTIAEIHSSCGCTVPHLEQRLYDPGESGTIRAVFTIGERVGLQEKVITVSTAAPDSSSTALTLRVQVPTLFEVKPYFVIWNTDEPPTPKTISLRLLAPNELAFASLSSRHANFSASAVATTAPTTLSILITPQSTAQPTNGSIEISLRQPSGKTRIVTIYAMIRAGRPNPSAPAIASPPAAGAATVPPPTE